MNDIIVTGHRNPDMDSVCAAWSYAQFKNIIDPYNNYIAVRCGNLNNQTKSAFKSAGVKPPKFIKDVSPKVSDVTRRDIDSLDSNEPVFTAIKVLDEKNISCIPIFENGSKFRGIVTMHQITRFLISENLGKRPIYQFRIDNFMKVLPGYFYKRGEESELYAPVMTGAMPIGVSRDRIEDLKPYKPVLVVGLREDLISFAIQNEFPAIILTGVRDDARLPYDFKNFKGTVYISKSDTAETIRLLRLSAPVKEIMNSNPEIIQADSSFDSAKNILVNSNYRGLPVFDDGSFTGIVTRRCFIEKPKKKLIMVDHNETSQSVPGADQAEIVEIIDHHRISPQPTKTPIYINIRPVGSTCSIVYRHYTHSGIEVSIENAKLLLSGILSDTVILKSPTTTSEDVKNAEELAQIIGTTVEDFGKKLFENSAVLGKRPTSEIIGGDFKEYREEGFSIGVGQAEVITIDGVNNMKEELISELRSVCTKKNLNWGMLLVTDIIHEHSVLITTPLEEAEELLGYNKLEDHLYDLPGILSRKKQLLPELLRVGEEYKLLGL